MMKVFQSESKRNLVSPCMIGSKLDKFEHVQMVGADQARGGGEGGSDVDRRLELWVGGIECRNPNSHSQGDKVHNLLFLKIQIERLTRVK